MAQAGEIFGQKIRKNAGDSVDFLVSLGMKNHQVAHCQNGF
jgi:hypothetical protein